MRLLISTALAASLAVTVPACKQQPTAGNAAAAGEEAAALVALNGTWMVDLASLKFGGKPDEYSLKGGSYGCATCIPPINVPADGQFHAVSGSPYYDSISIKVVDDRTIEMRRRKGEREVSQVTQQVSADGKTLTSTFKDMTTPGQIIDGKGTSTRVGAPVAGAHAISGQWQDDKIGEYSEGALDLVYKVEGDTVTSTSQGQTYVAKIGGPAVAVQNDPGGTMVKVERAGNGIKETYTRDGKDVGVGTLTPSADGRSVSYSSTDPRDGSTVSFTASKKS
jgi:hypothetical protein